MNWQDKELKKLLYFKTEQAFEINDARRRMGLDGLPMPQIRNCLRCEKKFVSVNYGDRTCGCYSNTSLD